MPAPTESQRWGSAQWLWAGLPAWGSRGGPAGLHLASSLLPSSHPGWLPPLLSLALNLLYNFKIKW